MFYAVLKGTVLYLYEDERCSDCYAALQVAAYDVEIYHPDSKKRCMMDGELFAKRNAICLRPKVMAAPTQEKEKGMPSVTRQMELEKVDVEARVAESGLKAKKAEKEREVLLEEARLKEEAREEAMDVATPWFIFVRYCIFLRRAKFIANFSQSQL